jgi:TolB-like protein
LSLFNELKQRNVFRVGFGYVISCWLLAQVADLVLENIGAPAWVMQAILMVLALGFPMVVFFAWAFEVTPDGIKRESEVDRSQSITHVTSRKLDRAITVVLLIAVAYFAYDKFVGSPRPDPAAARDSAQAVNGKVPAEPEAPADSEKSIAVLPLVNMSAIEDNIYFAGGVQEEILTNLSKIEGWRVVSRTTAMRYLNSELSLRDIGRELAVRYIVEGSVRRIKNHVRVTVQLIDASNDKHLWANIYDRELEDVFATQSAVAREITQSLQFEIEPESVGVLEDMPTRSVKAYDFYIKAKSIDRSEVESESNLTRRRELLEQAVAEDPDFVEAWGFLNEILDDMIRHANQSGWFVTDAVDRETLVSELGEQSRRALNKAIALDPDNLETLLAQASDSVAEFNREFSQERKKVIDRAIELYPDSAMAWYVLGWWYNLHGEPETAKPAFEKALALDPLNARIVWGSLVHFRLAGDQEMVTLLFERLAQIAPEKGQDKQLAKATGYIIQSRKLIAFSQTADQELILAFQDELDNDPGFYSTESDQRYYRTILWELNNNLEELLNLQEDIPLIDNPDGFYIQNYVNTTLRLLLAQQGAGRTDMAHVMARRIIAVEKIPVFHSIDFAAANHQALAFAYASLGETDEAQKWVDRLLNERSEVYNAYGLSGFFALAALDMDKAVELILEVKAQYPTWSGTDTLAMYHISARELLRHPDMQAFYLQEGKWMDYLAERVPEYEQLRQVQ